MADPKPPVDRDEIARAIRAAMIDDWGADVLEIGCEELRHGAPSESADCLALDAADAILLLIARAIDAARREERERCAAAPKIEFHQQDWIPGFAAFAPDATSPSPDARAFCVLNLGAVLAAVETSDLPRADVPYLIAESMMHEIMHALEQWAGCQFSEERIEALLERYRAAIRQETPDAR